MDTLSRRVREDHLALRKGERWGEWGGCRNVGGGGGDRGGIEPPCQGVYGRHGREGMQVLHWVASH